MSSSEQIEYAMILQPSQGIQWEGDTFCGKFKRCITNYRKLLPNNQKAVLISVAVHTTSSAIN